MVQPVFTDELAALDEAAFLAEQTGQRHSICLTDDGNLIVLKEWQARRDKLQIIETCYEV